jgi:hypothetical protein
MPAGYGCLCASPLPFLAIIRGLEPNAPRSPRRLFDGLSGQMLFGIAFRRPVARCLLPPLGLGCYKPWPSSLRASFPPSLFVRRPSVPPSLLPSPAPACEMFHGVNVSRISEK